jgi:hypothetical protein
LEKPLPEGRVYDKLISVELVRHKSLWHIPLFAKFQNNPSCFKWLSEKPMNISFASIQSTLLHKAMHALAVQAETSSTSDFAALVEENAGPDGIFLSR